MIGSKDSIKQKGIKVKKRRKLKAEVRPGKRFHVKGAFIQKVRSKQVFKRSGNKLYKQAVPSMREVIMEGENERALLKHVKRRFPEVFAKEAQFRIDRTNDKFNKKRLK